MRVTGGDARGRRLRPPASGETRPTSALVRSAIFNSLAARDFSGARVLDLYAGSGSLGIEALSRGAAWADFVEKNPRQCAIIRDNLALAGLRERARVHCAAVERAIEALEGPYGLVFLDPPYALTDLDGVLERLAARPILGEDAVVVVEHSKRTALRAAYGPLSPARSRQYGDTAVSMLTRGGTWW